MTKYIVKKSGKYWPSKAMKKIAWIKNPKIYTEAEKNPVKFWGKLSKEALAWAKPWKPANTYVQKLPYFSWFKGGKINFSINCLDRHLKKNPDKIALIWVPEPTKEKTIKLTYKEVYEKVNKFANVLKKYGVKKGDVVSIYLPLIPESVIAMLACTRIGAIHSIVFSAFSAEALKTRIQDGRAKILISCDGYYRRGKKEDLKKKVVDAIRGTKIKKIIMVNRLKKRKYTGKYTSFEQEIKKAADYCQPVIMNSEDTLFILYTSGTTGKPKGIIHDTGGYATQAYYTTLWDFNLHNDDIIWCTADIGWVTGHTYAVYGPLLTGNTTLIYEGSPDFPSLNRWWKIIDKNKVTALYTAPTAIRMFMKAGDKYLKNHKLSSLKILGTVGEPIDEDTWMWYFKKIGKSRCPIIDTWWQTETGGTLINVLPGIGPFVPTMAGKSFPGTRHKIVTEKGTVSKKGFLVQASPFAPGMLHGVWKNHKKYVETYWKKFKKYYDTSDGAVLQNNLIRITGRTDDVMKVAGHRLSTAELENSINKHKIVNESAVVSKPDKIKGEIPVAFIIPKTKVKDSEKMEKELKNHVDQTLGPTSRPSKVYFVSELPKTRSGKIMRRIMKDLLVNEKPKGLTTLVNPKCVQGIKDLIQKDLKQNGKK